MDDDHLKSFRNIHLAFSVRTHAKLPEAWLVKV